MVSLSWEHTYTPWPYETIPETIRQTSELHGHQAKTSAVFLVPEKLTLWRYTVYLASAVRFDIVIFSSSEIISCVLFFLTLQLSHDPLLI